MGHLFSLLERSAAAHPERIAVRDPDRDTQATYGEFLAFANRVAEALRAAGVSKGDRVGICSPKSVASLGAVFGALGADAAYVPVSYDNPASRNAFIFEDCKVKAVITQKELAEGLSQAMTNTKWTSTHPLGAFHSGEVELVLLGTEAKAASEAPDGLAYILYTSGSTGNPKGVIHTHASALSFIDWCSEVFNPTADDRFSAHAPFHFDLSILDIYVPIKHGGTVVLISEGLGKQPRRLAPAIADEKITMWYSTPSILRLLVEHGKMAKHDYSALRVVNFAGEVFPIKHLRALQQIWSHPRYFNLYGPTETNVCTYYEAPTSIPDTETEALPIGYACSGDEARVVDEAGKDVAPGDEGELVIAGGSVMVGYWNLPERNAAAFLEHGGKQWYKTGDVVRDAGGGCYIYISRRDRMVKRWGYRVELGEIEAALYKHPAITEAAAIALPDNEGGVVIKAFFNWREEGKPSILALKQFCAENLPQYMIPDELSVQDALPKTSTDKIDYQRLKTM